jgi:hypothetical protein
LTRKPIAISDLLAQGKTPLNRLRVGAEAAGEALAAVQQVLPPELVPHVWAASLEGAVLTVLVASGAWASRVRYSSTELAAGVAGRLKQPVSRVSVRVRPPGQARPAGRPRSQPPPRGG